MPRKAKEETRELDLPVDPRCNRRWVAVQRYYDLGHQLLCPNCHSQTENFAGRNVARNGSGADATA